MCERCNDIANNWNNWASQRPPEEGLYWWRIGTRKICGMDLAPEWVDEVCLHGMGMSYNELWPRFSHWDGYNRTVPAGTQWKKIGTEKKNDFFLPGVKLKTCPFCGQSPRISWIGRWVTAPIFHAESFSIKCPCGRASMSYCTNLQGLIERWNERAVTDVRNAALKEAAKVAKNTCLVPPDRGSPTEEEVDMCNRAAEQIRALKTN